MRPVVFILLLLSCAVRAQGVPDAFEITQRFADSGALQLALARVEQLQPASVAAPRWYAWEQLRCTLLGRLSRYQELAKRVAAQPANVDPKLLRVCILQGSRAAVAIGDAVTARVWLSRMIWRQDLAVDDLRQARLVVIESYLAENKPQDAYALMLRYQQDYKPVDRDTAARFVDALLASGMDNEAVNWMAALDDASPVKLLLRLRMNLAAPDAIIAQARAAILKANLAAYWQVIQQAGAAQKNRVVQAEALENLLQLAADDPAERVRAAADELWKTYAAAAEEVANTSGLLVGDDGGWADLAARRGTANPVEGRALFAYLALRSRLNATRQSAQLQLAFSLQNSKLNLVAVRLFDDATKFPVAQLDPQARYLLGAMAVESSQALQAARFWQGLQTPATVDGDEWRVRVAAVLVRAGVADAGVDALRALIAGKKSLAPDVMQRAVAVVQELQDTGFAKSADEMYRTLMPLAGPRERRDILFGLARLAESANDFQRAADFYLESALGTDSKTPDAFAINARIAAASNLARAGLKDDARAQFDWLRRNVREADRLEAIRREASRL